MLYCMEYKRMIIDFYVSNTSIHESYSFNILSTNVSFSLKIAAILMAILSGWDVKCFLVQRSSSAKKFTSCNRNKPNNSSVLSIFINSNKVPSSYCVVYAEKTRHTQRIIEYD